MKYNPDIHHRRSIRLKGYDYSKSGMYFVTICTQNRECLFGIIVGAGSKPALFNPSLSVQKNQNARADLEPVPTWEMQLNDFGVIVENTWIDLTNHNPDIVLGEFVVMPNHVHGIIQIINPGLDRAGLEPAPTGLSEIIRQFKTFSAKRINELRKSSGINVWQRNYYEHIIRNEDELNRIREYIINNPLNWETDQNNPSRTTINNTHEELNFTINYDIKYRMGRELDSSEENDE